MLLSDLDLTVLPSNVLIVLYRSIEKELSTRPCGQPWKKILSFDRSSIVLLPQRKDQDYQNILNRNSQSLLAMPGTSRKNHFRDRAKYLPCLLDQNWYSLFKSADNVNKNYYVYAHIDPRGRKTILEQINVVLNGDPFYIGKGSGNRAFDLKRNQGHGKRIKIIRDAGFPDASISSIISSNLTELEALSLEAKLIYYFGSIYDETANGCLLNLADHIKPIFVGNMTKLPSRRPKKQPSTTTDI